MTPTPTTPPTDALPTWREVEASDWFQGSNAEERRRILEHWEGELRATAAGMPDYKPDDEKWIGNAVRVARQRVNVLERSGGKLKQSGKLLLRGATSEGLYAGSEGASRAVSGIPELAGEVVARLEDLRDAASDLSPHEQLARAEARRERNRERLKDLAVEAPALKASLDVVKGYADATHETRESIRAALPVDPEFAGTLPGQIAQGIGQAAGTLPTFVVPGAGAGMSLGQLYQQGFDDAKAHGEDDAKAHLAGVANLPAAGLEYAADKLIVGKLLKPLRGKMTVGQFAKDVLAAGAVEGGTEGAQQAWQNYVAKELAKYDPDRPLDDQVLNSVLVGAVVGGAVTGGGALASEGGRRLDERSEHRAKENLDTGMNTPERPADLQAQQQQLARGDRAAQMFPLGTPELPLPEGMQRVETPRGVFHFDPRQITADEVLSASKAGRENDVLGLGPYSKPEVLERHAAGEPLAAMVERGPTGEELRGAVVTPSTAPETQAAMESAKSDGSAVRLEPLEETVAKRAEGAETLAPVEKRASDERTADYDALAGEVEKARERVSRRPAEQFKAEIETPDAQDVEIIGELAHYARLTDRANEDFGGFAQRLTDHFGEKVQAYLPQAWDSVSAGKPVGDLVDAAGFQPTQIESAWARALKFGRLFWEGSADVLRRGGFTQLASAVDRHVDYAERNLAQAWGRVRPSVERYMGAGKVLHSGEAQRVFETFADYYRSKESGRPEQAESILAAAPEETRQIVRAVRSLFAFTGYENTRLGVMVHDPNGGWRPMKSLGAENWPRMLNDETAAVLREPASNPARWEEMKQELLENGNIGSLDEADRFLRGAAPAESGNDFFGNIEKARAGRLPESWYEYDFWKVVPRFVAAWAERSAQIEAYGQRVGPAGSDAFERAMGQTRSSTARNYILAAQDHAYRTRRGDQTLQRALANVSGATSGLMLGNPWSAVRNLAGGVAQTVNQHGLLRSLEGLRDLWGGIADAEQAGAVKADVADLVFGGEGADIVRDAVGLTLKASGFSAAETFARAHSYLTARAFLRDAVAATRSDPTGRRSLQYRAFMQRLGADADTLVAENLKGPRTESFLRAAVRDAQGGYRFNQVPLFMDSALGRFLFQFGRWGTQAVRFHARNTFGPAVLGEVVTVRDGGQTVERRVRTLLPLLRSPLVAIGAGALTLALREALMGTARSDAGWDEIWRTKDDDQQRAFALALDRLANDVIFAGTFGALTDYGALLKDAATRNRFKNPIEPPAVSILKEAGALTYKLAQQGTLTHEDYERFFGAVVSGYRVTSRMVYHFADRLGAEWERARLERAENDRRFVRNAGYRFAYEVGVDESPYRSDWLPNVTPRTPIYARVEDALLLGDAFKANRLAAEYLASVPTANFRDARTALVSSVRSRQPVKPGGSTGHDMQEVFMEWARRRLSDAEYRRLVDVQTRYLETAERAQLLPVGNVSRWRRMADRPAPAAVQLGVRGADVLQGVGLPDDD